MVVVSWEGCESFGFRLSMCRRLTKGVNMTEVSVHGPSNRLGVSSD